MGSEMCIRDSFRFLSERRVHYSQLRYYAVVALVAIVLGCMLALARNCVTPRCGLPSRAELPRLHPCPGPVHSLPRVPALPVLCECTVLSRFCAWACSGARRPPLLRPSWSLGLPVGAYQLPRLPRPLPRLAGLSGPRTRCQAPHSVSCRCGQVMRRLVVSPPN